MKGERKSKETVIAEKKEEIKEREKKKKLK